MRRQVFVVMVEQADLTCSDHLIDVVTTLPKAKKLIRAEIKQQGGSGRGIQWNNDVEDVRAYKSVNIWTDFVGEDSGNPFTYTICVRRPE